MRTMNLKTGISGVVDALTRKWSRQLLGTCATIGVALAICPSSSAAGFNAPGWSTSGATAPRLPIIYGDPESQEEGEDNGEIRWRWLQPPSSLNQPFLWMEVLYSPSSDSLSAWIECADTGGHISGGAQGALQRILAGDLTDSDFDAILGDLLARVNESNGASNGFPGHWSLDLDYTLRYSAVTRVAIDIKPGSPENTVNLGSRGITKVAVLGTEELDATRVDPTTVLLADASVHVKGNGQVQTTIQDTNGDGFLDLVLHMETEGFTLTEGDTSATLTGNTFDGEAIQGADLVRVVP